MNYFSSIIILRELGGGEEKLQAGKAPSKHKGAATEPAWPKVERCSREYTVIGYDIIFWV